MIGITCLLSGRRQFGIRLSLALLVSKLHVDSESLIQVLSSLIVATDEPLCYSEIQIAFGLAVTIVDLVVYLERFSNHLAGGLVVAFISLKRAKLVQGGCFPSAVL